MQYLAGALITALLFAVFFTGYYVGRKTRTHKPREPDTQDKRNAEKMRQEFQALMNYDVSKAVGKRVE